jgi:hypothetical protein
MNTTPKLLAAAGLIVAGAQIGAPIVAGTVMHGDSSSTVITAAAQCSPARCNAAPAVDTVAPHTYTAPASKQDDTTEQV